MLDADMSWRIREISTFRLASKQDRVDRDTLIRAGVAMVYAHWEGFIKSASESYLEFVNNQGHLYRELKTCFVVFGMKGKLALLGDSRQAKTNIEVLDFVMSEMDQPAKMALSNAIRTEANLTSNVFRNIATSIDVPITQYESRFPLIDESLVGRRNSIAHGEYLGLKPGEFIQLADDVQMMMRWYKTDLQNAATLGKYKRALDAS
jgi:hypothetical protein